MNSNRFKPGQEVILVYNPLKDWDQPKVGTVGVVTEPENHGYDNSKECWVYFASYKPYGSRYQISWICPINWLVPLEDPDKADETPRVEELHEN